MNDLWELDRQLSADLDISSDFDGIPDPMRGLVRDKVLTPVIVDYEAAKGVAYERGWHSPADAIAVVVAAVGEEEQ